jgi:hypothetical protein
MRDIQALTTPGTNTTVNAAHNVPLDILASGGFLLFLSYIAIMIIVSFKIYRLTRLIKNYDPIFVSLVAAWAAYQVQSIISINQIGLAVWGWVLSGLIVAYESALRGRETSPKHSRRGGKSADDLRVTIISPGLLAGVGALVGALIAFPPLNSDLKWRAAQVSRDALKLEKALESGPMNPSNTLKYLNSIQLFEQSGLTELAHRYSLEAVRFNPDSYDSWKFLYLIRDSTSNERKTAIENMQRLDPLNPDVTAQ